MNEVFNEGDKTILKRLAEEIANIAASDQHTKTKESWTRLNDLESNRPMVYIYQIPWREMNVDDELTIRTTDPDARRIEQEMRMTIYQWKHMPGDMVVDPFYRVHYALKGTGLGLSSNTNMIPHDAEGGVNSIHYNAVLQDESDLDKIKTPNVSCDWEATEALYQKAKDAFGDVLPVVKRGPTHGNYSPWDRLSELMNPQQVLLDLIMRPDFIHEAMNRITNAYCSEVEQIDSLNLRSYGEGNLIAGNGGLSYTKDLPQKDFDESKVRSIDQWGGSMAQIFSEVSPEMHEEFALKYEKRFLDRFGLNYYGCCEPLHHKVDVIARNLPKLRKISMSCWVDAEKGAKAIDGRFVFSFKPNPAFLATQGEWAKNDARKEIQKVLEINKGRPVEIILKDISTVQFDPKRLWEWNDMVMEMCR